MWTKIAERLLAVVNPTLDARLARRLLLLSLASGLAAVGAWTFYAYTRTAVELSVLAGFVLWVQALRRARRRAAGVAAELTDLRASFEARLEEAVRDQTSELVAGNLLLSAERDEARRALAEAEVRVAEALRQAGEVKERLDLSGQFVAVCIRWWFAAKTKKAVRVVGGVPLDRDYWWKQVETVARKRWPARGWTPDELLAAAQEVAEGIDLARWRRVVNSEFGLTLPA